MTELRPLTLLDLPDELLQCISDYCELETRFAVSCTNSALTAVFRQSLRLTREASNRFLVHMGFIARMRLPGASQRLNIHLHIDLREFSQTEIDILNSVRSVKMCITDKHPTQPDYLRLIQTLTEIWVDWREFSDLSILAGLTNLHELDLGNTKVMDVSILAGLTNLKLLWLWSTKVSDVSPLADLINLTEVDLSDTQISDVSVLAGLTNLTYLALGQTQVSDVSELKTLTNLTELHLENTQVSHVSALAGLTNLTYLDLDGTRVSDLSALACLPKLKRLSVSLKNVSEISVLQGITEVTIYRVE